MLEELEGLKSSSTELKENPELSNQELDYLKECVAPPRPESLALRIDEIQKSVPPKALDSNPQIAELIEPVRDIIPNKYLEAPTDMEQVDQISDLMVEHKGVKIEDWKELTFEQRVEILNQLETRIAEIEHRPPCPIGVKNLGPITEYKGELQGHMGYHEMTFGGERIVINSELIKSDNPDFHNEVLDTVVHEGRHSYQTYNLECRETHTSQGDLTNWRINKDEFGYQSPDLCGFKLYWMQPLEADARKFAEDVLTAYKNKL